MKSWNDVVVVDVAAVVRHQRRQVVHRQQLVRLCQAVDAREARAATTAEVGGVRVREHGC
jgi:hypothetical protein